ncbi:MAG TPA: hypothetical protein VKV15_21640 [Bryobacteraceae bacterium]|nr:hypothetical protein [Bryobacteraceae bacterium]
MRAHFGSPRTSQRVTPISGRTAVAANHSKGVPSSATNGDVEKHVPKTQACPPDDPHSGEFVEAIRDCQDPQKMMFLRWGNRPEEVVSEIERCAQIFVPPTPGSKSFQELSLPTGLEPCGAPAKLCSEIISAISEYVKVQPDELLICAAAVLASWFPDCAEVAPYLWITGPLGSGKTKLLKLLWCLCRRGLLVGDVRAGSLYQIVDAWNPTLLVDELDFSNSTARAELLRLLRSGSVPGTPTIRNGKRYSIYGLKAFSSRQSPDDAALASRGLIISMSPTACETPALDNFAMRALERKFQSRMCRLRLRYHAAVKKQHALPMDLEGLSPRMKQIARALAAPLLGDRELTAKLIAALRDQDEQASIERSLEPEWLVVTDLMTDCHEGLERGRPISEIFVGGIASSINQRLKFQGEDIRLSAKKVGLTLKSLGLRPESLGRTGRGLRLTSALKLKIHQIAARLGIDRRTIAPMTALETGYGGVPCALCKKFKLTGGLRFIALKAPMPRRRPASDRRELLKVVDNPRQQRGAPKKEE